MDDTTQTTDAGWWTRLNRKWWGRLIRDAILIGAVFYGISAIQGWNLLGSGEPAPDFTLKTMAGETVQLEALRGQKVLLVFWAPWCGVCGAESGNISALHEVYKDADGPKVMSVVLGYNGLGPVKKFMEDNGVDYPVLLGNASVRDAFQIDKYPTAYVISEEGAIEDAMVGYTTEWGMRLRLLL